jgi:hypothetical protein
VTDLAALAPRDAAPEELGVVRLLLRGRGLRFAARGRLAVEVGGAGLRLRAALRGTAVGVKVKGRPLASEPVRPGDKRQQHHKFEPHGLASQKVFIILSLLVEAT